MFAFETVLTEVTVSGLDAEGDAVNESPIPCFRLRCVDMLLVFLDL